MHFLGTPRNLFSRPVVFNFLTRDPLFLPYIFTTRVSLLLAIIHLINAFIKNYILMNNEKPK